MMIKLLFYLLEKIPYRTKFGLSFADELKYFYYYKIGQYKNPQKCLCGGIISTIGVYPDGWITDCVSCGFLVDED